MGAIDLRKVKQALFAPLCNEHVHDRSLAPVAPRALAGIRSFSGSLTCSP